MLRDARDVGATPTVYDVLIVGGGPAGICLAVELSQSGLRVGLLESGGADGIDADTQALYDGPVTGNEDDLDLAAIRLRALGGTSLHWGGHCAPLDRIDFERAPAGFSGWPLSYDAMVPYWERASVHCDLGAFDYGLDAPQDLAREDLLLNDSADVETAILRQSRPTRFDEKYLSLLADSPGVDLWLWANATHVEMDADGAVRHVETRTLEGITRVFEAKATVLACGAVENARLLMASNARNGMTFGNAGDLLGRCYMDHPAGGAGFIRFDAPQPPRPYWQDIDTYAADGIPFHFVLRLSDAALLREDLPNIQYYVIPLSADLEVRARQRAARRSIGGLRNVVKYAIGRDVGESFSLSREYCAFITNADSFVHDTAITFLNGQGPTNALLKFEQEQRPDRTNRVVLSESRDALGGRRAGVHWAPSQDEVAAVKRATAIVGAAVGAEGLGRVELETHDADPYWGMTTSWHQMGTTRMAEATTSGVCDPQGRVHGTDALYMTGTSLFPTAGRANPTLTAVALSVRLADHLKTEVPRL